MSTTTQCKQTYVYFMGYSVCIPQDSYGTLESSTSINYMHPPSALAYDNQIALRVCVKNRPNRIYGTGQLSGNNVDMSWDR